MPTAFRMTAGELSIGDKLLNDLGLTGTVTRITPLSKHYICLSINNSPGILVEIDQIFYVKKDKP